MVGLLVASGVAWFAEARLADMMLAQVALRAVDQVQLGVLHRVTAADFEPPHTPQKLDDLEARLAPLLARVREEGSGVLRLYLFARDGTVLFCDRASERGRIGVSNSPLFAAALAGNAGAQLSSLSSPKNADLKARYDGALEAYVPFIVDGQVVGVYEIYQDLAPIRPLRPLVWSVAIGGLSVLFLALLPVVHGAAARIRRQRVERERLLQQTIEAFRELARQAIAEPDAERVLGLICEQAGRLVGADYAAVVGMEADGTRVCHGAWGMRTDAWRVPRPVRTRGAVARALATRGTAIATDLAEGAEASSMHAAEGGRTALATPLFGSQGLLGGLLVGWRTDERPTAEQVHLAEALAGYAATILDNARAHRNLTASEEQARAAAERLEHIIEGTGDAIIVSDLERRILSWNRGAEQIFGWSRQEVLGQIAPFVPADLLEDSLRRRQQVIETGQTIANYEAERLTRDGRRIPVLGTISPLRDQAGTIVAMLGITKDISAYKQLAEQSRRLALLEQRERIAMDLHDGVIQSLYAVGLTLGAQARTLNGNADETRAALRQAMAQLNGAIREIRAYILSLRLREPEEHGLRPRLEALAQEVQASIQVCPQLELAEGVDGPLEPEAVANLLYIAREATANVIRHAGARAVAIRLEQAEGRLVLTIRDDGRGFDPRRMDRQAGDGLRNMAERARVLGGHLVVLSEPGHGTEVRVEVPAREGRASPWPNHG
ncbi:MAG: GAF domain-containing sensor histidine kinase [Chloroflexi bacterium]|nr:GAF domain-containing sensor histidine kinase [Chloroflexota bacterium]